MLVRLMLRGFTFRSLFKTNLNCSPQQIIVIAFVHLLLSSFRIKEIRAIGDETVCLGLRAYHRRPARAFNIYRCQDLPDHRDRLVLRGLPVCRVFQFLAPRASQAWMPAITEMPPPRLHCLPQDSTVEQVRIKMGLEFNSNSSPVSSSFSKKKNGSFISKF